MIKFSFLLASVVASTMLMSAALAQSVSSETTTLKVLPSDENYNSHSSQKTIDSSGTETNRNQTYTSGVGGTSASSSTQTTTPDGSQTNTTTEERNMSPRGESTTTTRKTTTTTD